MNCFAPLCDGPHLDGYPGRAGPDSAWLRFLEGPDRARVLIEVQAARLSGPLATVDPGEPFMSVPHAGTAAPPVALGETTFLFGDGVWISRPDDPVRPNVWADARVMSAGEVERTVPISPEASRRGEVNVGEIELANGDGGLDRIAAEYSVSGRQVRVWLGPARGRFGEFRLIQDGFAGGLQVDHSRLILQTDSVAQLLQQPLQTQRFTGAGARGGDQGLRDRLLPVCVGEVFNITPVLLNADQWVYQVHDGPILAVDAVRERGLALTAMGIDVATYAALRQLDVPAGFWATCHALGLVKVGLGVAGPAGAITMDVRGDASRGGYSSATGDILLKAAIGRARLDPSLIDTRSFAELPRQRVGWYSDGSADLTVADLFDAQLRPLHAYYGASRSAALQVARSIPPSPERAWIAELTRQTILDVEEIPVDQPPRFAQSALWGRNWTVLSDDDISPAVDAGLRERLRNPGSIVRRVQGQVQRRARNAIEGDELPTFFVDQDGAASACETAMALFSESRRRYRLSLTRSGFRADVGNIVRVSYPRFALNGLNLLVIGVRDAPSRGRAELTVWG